MPPIRALLSGRFARLCSFDSRHNPRVRIAMLISLFAVGLAAPASLASSGTKLTITTWLEGGRSAHSYSLTCAPAAVRGLPAGTLQAADACAALREIGERLYGRSLSKHVKGCNYIQAPRRALLVGSRNGRPVRTEVEVGACERLVVPLRLLNRVVVWSRGAATR
jgi:hypothetical protein